MPRINIEDSIHKDARFDALAGRMGGKQNALGALVWAWTVAQPYWVRHKSGVPKPVWEKQGVRNEIIEVGLAREDGDFVHVCGSEDQFAWLIKNKESGKLGGQAKARNNRENSLAKPSEPYRVLPSSSSSPSSSSLKTKTNTLVQFKNELNAFLLKIYSGYPRKQGKARGLKSLARGVAPGDLPLLERSLSCFVAHHAARKTDPQFIPLFSTWANEWREWLEPGHGGVVAPAASERNELEKIKQEMRESGVRID